MTRTPGSGERNDPDWSIRQETTIDAPVDQVWTWLAHPERVSQWWCPPPTVTIDFDPTTGGDYTEAYRDEDDESHLTGTVVAFDPGRRFAVRRDTAGRFGSVDFVEFDLLATEGGTRVTLVHSFSDLPDGGRGEAEAYFASGWNWSLGELRALVEDPVE